MHKSALDRHNSLGRRVLPNHNHNNLDSLQCRRNSLVVRPCWSVAKRRMRRRRSDVGLRLDKTRQRARIPLSIQVRPPNIVKNKNQDKKECARPPVREPRVTIVIPRKLILRPRRARARRHQRCLKGRRHRLGWALSASSSGARGRKVKRLTRNFLSASEDVKRRYYLASSTCFAADDFGPLQSAHLRVLSDHF